jgi:regulator of sigma E protease
MVKEMKKVAERSMFDFVSFLGAISAYLAVFNLLPVPALDGGRLLFLGYEAVTRKRPNPTMEAQIHGIALVMLLGLMIYITVANDLGLGAK